jgi:hypothetical protein
MKNSDDDKIYKETIQNLLEELRKSTIDNRLHLRDRILRMIDYTIGRLDYYENYRKQYLQLGVAIIGLSITLFALVAREYLSLLASSPDKLSETAIILSFSAVAGMVFWLAWVGGRQILLYVAYTSPEYPYRDMTETDWFFRYIKKQPDEKYLLRNKFGKNEDDTNIKNVLKNLFIEDLSDFGKRIIQKSLEESMINDIDQLICLHTLVQYKQAHTAKMRRWLWIDIRILLVIMVITIVIMICAA